MVRNIKSISASVISQLWLEEEREMRGGRRERERGGGGEEEEEEEEEEENGKEYVSERVQEWIN